LGIAATTALTIVLATWAGCALADEENEAPATVAEKDAPPTFDPQSLVDAKIDLTLSTGETVADIKVVKVGEGRTPGTVSSLTVVEKGTGKPRLLGAIRIREIAPPGGRPILVFDAAKRALVPPSPQKAKVNVSQEPQEGAEADQETAASDRQWPELSDEEQRAAVQKDKAFVEEAKSKIPHMGLQLYETKRFLFYSDIPAQAITTMYVPYLDQMYEKLCAAFGVDPQRNIWLGKATVIAFANKASFQQFEATFFAEAGDRVQGLAHCRGDGAVLISCYAGSDPKYFATVLVHETAHGFTFRYKSAHRVPSWLNEGISEWISHEVVVGPGWIRPKVQQALEQIKMTHSLGGNFFSAEHIDAWQYSVAATMMELLLKSDAPQGRGKSSSRSRRNAKAEVSRFRKLFEGIKQGTPWEKSLQDSYGCTPAELAQKYGQLIGVPDLRP
jgi:hypothetical protein